MTADPLWPQDPVIPTEAVQFAGHEFHYEPSTDLFRCTRCHAYEIAYTGSTPAPCPGEPPAGSSKPIEVNAW